MAFNSSEYRISQCTPHSLPLHENSQSQTLIAKQKSKADAHLSALNEALRGKLQEWLAGFLTLERITWNSPAVVLEKVGAVSPKGREGDVESEVYSFFVNYATSV